MKLYESNGILRYGKNNRLVVEIDQAIVQYYRSLIPKYKPFQTQLHKPHITIVRTGKEVAPNREYWGKREGDKVVFLYSPIVNEGMVYYWLDVYSHELEEIRKELGLSIESEYEILEGFNWRFHITLGNKKLDTSR